MQIFKSYGMSEAPACIQKLSLRKKNADAPYKATYLDDIDASRPTCECDYTSLYNIPSYLYIFLALRCIPHVRSKGNVKTLRSQFFAGLCRHCMLRGGTQHRIMPRQQSEEMKI